MDTNGFNGLTRLRLNANGVSLCSNQALIPLVFNPQISAFVADN
jgi:hypothetical protein